MRSSLAVPEILQPAIRMYPKQKRELGWEAEYGILEMCRDSWNWQKKNQTAIRSKIVEIHQNVCFVEKQAFFVEIL